MLCKGSRVTRSPPPLTTYIIPYCTHHTQDLLGTGLSPPNSPTGARPPKSGTLEGSSLGPVPCSCPPFRFPSLPPPRLGACPPGGPLPAHSNEHRGPLRNSSSHRFPMSQHCGLHSCATSVRRHSGQGSSEPKDTAPGSPPPQGDLTGRPEAAGPAALLTALAWPPWLAGVGAGAGLGGGGSSLVLGQQSHPGPESLGPGA